MAGDRIPLRALAGLTLGTLVVTGGLAAAFVLLFQMSDRDTREIIAATQRVLRARFPQALEIRFAPVADTHVDPQGESRYSIQGWIEVTGFDGEKKIFDFSCTMLTLTGSEWIPEKVEISPRR
jgi:hypothetical protein